MAITCLGLDADGKFSSEILETLVESNNLSLTHNGTASSQLSGEAAFKQGDYRDILNLTRVLIYGPKSKEEVDMVIER